jgi:hypothetical protein
MSKNMEIYNILHVLEYDVLNRNTVLKVCIEFNSV